MTPVSRPPGSSLLHAAECLAARGWHVFPCVPGGKRPALRDNWQQLATIDPARILRWWTRMPFNIGISCGPSGLVVLDLDLDLDVAKAGSVDDQPPGSGADSLAELCKRHGQPYPVGTFTVSTPRGTHLYFLAPSRSPRNSAGRLGSLIDVRAAGGYVIAPGSRVCGLRYDVVDTNRPSPLPDWIATLLDDRPAPAATHRLPASEIRQPISYAQTALREETARVTAAPTGTRNDTLNCAAFSLGQLVVANLLPADTVMTALADAAERCGLPRDEAHRTIRSGMTSGMRHPRTQRPRPTSRYV
jgi:Bifunctional DNA primase/polymerase, N-terminal